MGIENYGLWMIATSTLGIMSIAEFGLNTAISKFVAEYVSSGDTRALSAVVTGGAIIYIILGFGLIVPMYMLSPTLAGVFKPSDVISDEQIGYVIRIMSLGFFPLLLRNGALAIPIGIQRFELPVLINIVYQIFSYTVALFVSLLGGSVAQIVISNIIVLWITALVSLLIAWQMLKPHHIKLVVRKTKKITNQLLSFALMSGFSSLGSRIFGFTDRLVVGAVLGLEAVAYYTVIVSVANKIL